MANSIHISTLRKMLKAGDPVDLKVWTKSGEICDSASAMPSLLEHYRVRADYSNPGVAKLRSTALQFLQGYTAVQTIEQRTNSPSAPGVRVHGQ